MRCVYYSRSRLPTTLNCSWNVYSETHSDKVSALGGSIFSSIVVSHCFYHNQHRIPRLPQLHTRDHEKCSQTTVGSDPVEQTCAPHGIHVGYLLHRHPVVKPTLHPLERSMAFLLEKQHQLYSRHSSSDTACHFFRDRQQQNIDAYQRTDPQDIRRDFFGLEGYQDALKATLQRYQQVPTRLQPADFIDSTSRFTSPQHTTLPTRHTLQRKLDDYLYLIVRYAIPSSVENMSEIDASRNESEMPGKWGIPFTPLRIGETLRMAAERCLQEPHRDNVDYYLWGCGSQGAISFPQTKNTEDEAGKSFSSSVRHLFVHSATYLAGKPDFSRIHPTISDHAWVSRRELLQYRSEFASEQLLELLLDISADAYFETE